jgi:hypothetical protein
MDDRRLLLAVLVHVSLCGIFRMIVGMDGMRPRRMGMMCRLFMVSRFMMFGGFGVMPRRMRMMVGGMLVMVGSFF